MPSAEPALDSSRDDISSEQKEKLVEEIPEENVVEAPPVPDPEVSSELEVDSSESEEIVVEAPQVPHPSSPPSRFTSSSR